MQMPPTKIDSFANFLLTTATKCGIIQMFQEERKLNQGLRPTQEKELYEYEEDEYGVQV
jgi:hypothetical protein